VQWSEQDMALQSGRRPEAVKQAAVHIVTDAAGSITREDAARLGMTLLDSYIIVGDKSLPETMYSPAELYALMRQGVKVSTAQASVFGLPALPAFSSATARPIFASARLTQHQAVSAWKEQNQPAG
jgi:hypothetical protein